MLDGNAVIFYNDSTIMIEVIDVFNFERVVLLYPDSSRANLLRVSSAPALLKYWQTPSLFPHR